MRYFCICFLSNYKNYVTTFILKRSALTCNTLSYKKWFVFINKTTICIMAFLHINITSLLFIKKSIAKLSRYYSNTGKAQSHYLCILFELIYNSSHNNSMWKKSGDWIGQVISSKIVFLFFWLVIILREFRIVCWIIVLVKGEYFSSYMYVRYYIMSLKKSNGIAIFSWCTWSESNLQQSPPKQPKPYHHD